MTWLTMMCCQLHVSDHDETGLTFQGEENQHVQRKILLLVNFNKLNLSDWEVSTYQELNITLPVPSTQDQLTR